MATLTILKDGGFNLQFYRNKKRYTIYLGKKYSRMMAIKCKEIVETLLYYSDNMILIPSPMVTAWIESAPEEIRQKLKRAGLVNIPDIVTCEKLWSDFLEQMTDVKNSTKTAFENVRDHFLSYFPNDSRINMITENDCREWKKRLLKQLAVSTVAKIIKRSRQLFTFAVDRGLICRSPFSGVVAGSMVNRENDRIVTIDEYIRLLEKCPSDEWRVIVSLARIGGLRCPSELINLRWSDINWEIGTVRIYSPKTERYVGKVLRVVPLFPDLRIELERLYFSGSDFGSEFVINNVFDRCKRVTLSSAMGKIAELAGVENMIRPFDNMRMSRSNEVLRRYGSDLEELWIGHSAKVRRDHYYVVSDSDIRFAQSETLVVRESNIDQKKIPCEIPCEN